MPSQASLIVDSGAMRSPRILLWLASCLWTLVEGTPGLDVPVCPYAEALHVQTAQRYANAAYQDGLTLDTIRDLASLAAWGRLSVFKPYGRTLENFRTTPECRERETSTDGSTSRLIFQSTQL